MRLESNAAYGIDGDSGDRLNRDDRTSFTSVVPTASLLQLHEGLVIDYATLLAQNSSLQAVISKIATNGGQMPIGVYMKVGGGGERLGLRDAMVQLLDRPTLVHLRQRMRISATPTSRCTRTSYGVKVRDDAGRVRQLVRIPPALVSLVDDPAIDVRAYRV